MTLLVLLSSAHLFAAPDIQTSEGRGLERARIASERAVLNSKFDAQDQECLTRFIVTSCRDEVRLQRIRSLDPLNRQEAILNDIDRKATAAKQQQKLDDKTSASAVAEKEKNRQDALATSAKRAAEREHKNLEKEQESTENKPSTRVVSKALSPTEQDKAQKRAAYEQKQLDLLERRKRREEGLRDLAEKQKERDKEEALKAEKYAKAVEAAAAAKAAKP